MASHLNTLIRSSSSSSLPILLRTIQPADAPAFSSLLSSAHGADPHSRPLDVSAAESIIARQRESASQPTVLGPDGRVVSGPSRVNMALVLLKPPADSAPAKNEEGLMIGLGGFGAIKDWERDGKKIRAGDVGVMIDPEYRGKGYGLEAMKMAISWAFSTASAGGPQLDLVTITALEDNAPMLKLLNQKLALQGKGVARPAEHDESKQEIYYELAPKDWKRISAIDS